jgi:UDP-glucose 4-epimerase
MRSESGMRDKHKLSTPKESEYSTRSTIPNSLLRGSWLITGGAGFIGCNLINRLLAGGVPYIRVLDNLSVGARKDLDRVCSSSEIEISSLLTPVTEDRRTSTGHRKRLSAPTMANQFSSGGIRGSSSVHLIVGDIRDASVCLHAAKDMDVIVHLAANPGVAPSVENPRLDMETNVVGTLNMLEAARKSGAKRFIFASSGAPLGECQPPIHEELAPHPVSPYGASKLAGEGYCSAYYRTFGLETVCLRFGNVYGPLSSHKSSVIAKFIRQALAGEICEIYGNGDQTRDFIYVVELVDAVVKAAENDVAGETFQIATNKEHAVNEVVRILSNQLRTKAGCALSTTNIGSRVGDVSRNFSDTSKALRLLNWQPQIRLDEGISRTLDWFLTNGQNEEVVSVMTGHLEH